MSTIRLQKRSGHNGKYQILYSGHIRIVHHVFTCAGLHVNPIQTARFVKEYNDGNCYFAGEFGIVSTLLVFRQPGYEVVDWPNSPD